MMASLKVVSGTRSDVLLAFPREDPLTPFSNSLGRLPIALALLGKKLHQKWQSKTISLGKSLLKGHVYYCT